MSWPRSWCFPHHAISASPQRMSVRRQRRTRLVRDRYAERPTRGRDRAVARKSAGSALELGEADRDERAGFRNLIGIRNGFCLSEVMLQEPFLAHEFRSGIVSIQGFVPVHQNMSIQM